MAGAPAIFSVSLVRVSVQRAESPKARSNHKDSCISGTKCWNGGGARATNGNWFHSASRKRSSDKTCTSPSVFEYTDAEGQFRAIKVLDGASAEIIADHYSSANFTALAEYELGKQFLFLW